MLKKANIEINKRDLIGCLIRKKPMPTKKRFTEKLIVLLTPAQKNKLEKTERNRPSQ